MAKTYQLYLRMREADEADYGRSVVRIHRINKPQRILWGGKVDISVDKRNWVTCKLEPAGNTGPGHIYIDVPTRTLINRHTLGFNIARLHEPCDFYIRKAIPWKTITYISTVATVAAIIIAIIYLLDLL